MNYFKTGKIDISDLIQVVTYWEGGQMNHWLHKWLESDEGWMKDTKPQKTNYMTSQPFQQNLNKLIKCTNDSLLKLHLGKSLCVIIVVSVVSQSQDMTLKTISIGVSRQKEMYLCNDFTFLSKEYHITRAITIPSRFLITLMVN